VSGLAKYNGRQIQPQSPDGALKGIIKARSTRNRATKSYLAKGEFTIEFILSGSFQRGEDSSWFAPSLFSHGFRLISLHNWLQVERRNFSKMVYAAVLITRSPLAVDACGVFDPVAYRVW